MTRRDDRRDAHRRVREATTTAERAAALRALDDTDATLDEDTYRRQTRRAFLTGAVGAAAMLGGWRWIQSQPESGNVPTFLRNGYEWNESLWRAIDAPTRTVPEFDVSEARPLRVNGRVGIRSDIDLEDWRLSVEGPDGSQIDELTMDDLRALPTRDLVCQHKCIEGWNTIAHWTGIPFAEFFASYRGVVGDVPYVALSTPDPEPGVDDRAYYVGLHLNTMLHPQTLLGTGLDGQPLTPEHGAPLRLVVPSAYGIKSIKRIARIQFANTRPDDFWAERGYDWYSVH